MSQIPTNPSEEECPLETEHQGSKLDVGRDVSNIEGNSNRAIQGNKNDAVQGNENQIAQGNSNQMNKTNISLSNENCKSEAKMDLQSPVGVAAGNVQGDLIVNHYHNSSNAPQQAKESIDDKVNTLSDDSSTQRLAFVITGSLDGKNMSRAKFKALVKALKKISVDACLEIESIEEGSIKIILKGSNQGLNRIKQLFESGELTDELISELALLELDSEEFSIEEVRDLTDAENQKIDEKSQLVAPNKLDGQKADLSWADLSWANLSGANLIIADLSWANLSWANLSWANLSWANLIRADLSWANLSGADLSWANLSWADLSEADLSGASLIGADLSVANLSGANLTLAKFSSHSSGISEEIKQNFIRRGAIFEDAAGDRSRALVRR